MLMLGINTTRNFLTIVLVKGDKTIVKTVEGGNKKHTSILLPQIDSLLAENNCTINDLEYISAVVGPGSFTGIRVGVSCANALAYSLNIPMIEVTSLELIAYNKQNGVALIDALHGNYYGGTIENGNIINMRYYEKDDVIDAQRYVQDVNDDYGTPFAEILKAKAIKGDIKKTLVPLYLRESQAEREAKNK